MSSTDPGMVAPYGPWQTFQNFVRNLNGTVVPPVVDSTLLRNLSGSAQSQLRGALRFLSLVEGDDDRVTDRLRELVAASRDAEQWKAALARVVPHAYQHITEGVDLDTGTRGQLVDAFRDRGRATGSVNEKAVRFFLAAMTAAGRSLSPHFGASVPASNGSRDGGGTRKTNGRTRQRRGSEESEERKPPPPGSENVLCSMPGGRTVTVTIPADLSASEQDFLVTYLQGYFTLKRER